MKLRIDRIYMLITAAEGIGMPAQAASLLTCHIKIHSDRPNEPTGALYHPENKGVEQNKLWRK
jgi:hypothetical protein